MTSNWKELVILLKSVIEKDGIDIIHAIMDRIYQIHKLPENSNPLIPELICKTSSILSTLEYQ